MKPKRGGVVKIAVSLPRSLYLVVEKERRASGLSRSAIVQRALAESVARRARAKLVERYVERYRKNPETPAEVAAAMGTAGAVLEQEPWD
jgi:hypothetical protein